MTEKHTPDRAGGAGRAGGGDQGADRRAGIPGVPGAPADGTVTTSRTTGVRGVPLTVSRPREAATAGIVVIQDAFGPSEAMVDATRTLAAQGYLAVLPHLYHRRTDAPVTTFDDARPLMGTLNADDLQFDITDARDYVEAVGVEPSHLGIVGFCMGGTVSLWQATTGDFAAAVTFYGGGVAKSRWRGVPPGLEAGAALRCPWLGLYGDKDRSIPSEQVEELRGIVSALPVPTSIVRYPTAGHAFATDPSSPMFVAEAAADSWARALSWFDAHLR